MASHDPLAALAFCIEYPSADLLDRVDEALALVRKRDRGAAKQLGRFRDFVASASLQSMEELYTRTFDLEPRCCLYTGYHLFGDTHRRGVFMAQLVGWYRASDFPVATGELPDHLAVLLRFFPSAPESEEKIELAEYCLRPALDKIAAGLNRTGSPYEGLLGAIRILVNGSRGAGQ